MRKKVDGCVDCGLPCMSYCELRDNTYEYTCDLCGDEVASDELHDYDGKEICADCLLKIVPKAY